MALSELELSSKRPAPYCKPAEKLDRSSNDGGLMVLVTRYESRAALLSDDEAKSIAHKIRSGDALDSESAIFLFYYLRGMQNCDLEIVIIALKQVLVSNIYTYDLEYRILTSLLLHHRQIISHLLPFLEESYQGDLSLEKRKTIIAFTRGIDEDIPQRLLSIDSLNYRAIEQRYFLKYFVHRFGIEHETDSRRYIQRTMLSVSYLIKAIGLRGGESTSQMLSLYLLHALIDGKEYQWARDVQVRLFKMAMNDVIRRCAFGYGFQMKLMLDEPVDVHARLAEIASSQGFLLGSILCPVQWLVRAKRLDEALYFFDLMKERNSGFYSSFLEKIHRRLLSDGDCDFGLLCSQFTGNYF
jgi:pentatricopeptide repeat protein